jgi:alginate O-acetyltransferase complex protein AlgJ
MATSNRPATVLAVVGDVAVLAVFAVICAAHLVFGADHGHEGGLRESRRLAEPPPAPADLAGLPGWIRGYEKWFDDHFAFRPRLQELEAALRMRVFGVSPSEQVVVGEDGWLYFTQNGILADRRGEVVMSEALLESWRLELEARQRLLAGMGVPYVFAVAPNKVTIHPEHLPPRERAVSGRPTRLDQLVAHLAATSSFRLLDGRPPLREAARTAQVYHATDSHWNELGAFPFYQELVRALQRQGLAIEPLTRDHFTPARYPVVGDLGRIAPWLRTPPEQGWFMTARAAHPASRVELPFDHTALPTSWQVWEPPVMQACDQGEGVLLFVGDSFQWPMIPWLARHFRASVFLSVAVTDLGVLREIVMVVKPTVVIEQRVERNLVHAPTTPR